MVNALAGLSAGMDFTQGLQNTFDNSRLNRLAGMAYEAPQEQRQSLLGKMAAINPQAAQTQQQQFQSDDDRKMKQVVGAARYMKSAMDTNNPAALAGAWRAVRPGLIRAGLANEDELSPDWDPSYAETVHQLLAMGEGQGGTGAQPTQFTALDLQAKAAGYQPGTQGYRDFFKRANGELARQSGAAIGYQKITGPDGREYLVATDPRGIGAQVVGDGTGYGSFGDQQQDGVPQAAPQRADMEADIELANSMIAAGIPEAQVDAFLAQRGQRVPAPSAAQGAPAPASSGPVAGNPFASRTPEEQAALTEQAKTDVQLRNLPTELDLRTQAEINKTRGVEQAKTEAERDAQAPKRIKQYEQAIGSAGSVMTSLDNAIKLIGPTTAGWGGARLRKVEGTDAYNLASEIETIKANLGFDRLQQMRDNSPTGGALGAIAVQELVALQSTIANLDPNQSEEQIKQNLERVKKHYEGWVSAVQQALQDERRGAQAGPQAAAGQRTIARTGTANGRKVIQYSDGSVEYGN